MLIRAVCPTYACRCCFSTRSAFLALLALFTGIYLILTFLISPSFSGDHADLLIFSQRLAWGYNHQPPLYSWLAWVFFRTFGLNHFALALLKALILGVVYLTLYQSARQMLGDDLRAVLATLAVLLIPA